MMLTGEVTVIGYIASLFVAFSFYMKTMIPLRLFALASNICFILYALLGVQILYPVLALHVFLFPLNLIRLWQINKLIKDVRSISNKNYSFEWLIPYMSKKKI